MSDLEDDPTDIAEDIIKQAGMGFNSEAEQRILNILTTYHNSKDKADQIIAKLKQQNDDLRNDSSDEDTFEGPDKYRFLGGRK